MISTMSLVLVSVMLHDNLTFAHCEMISTMSLVTICFHTVIAVSLAIFLMLYSISPWLVYFMAGGLYLLIPFTYFCTTPHSSVLCIFPFCLFFFLIALPTIMCKLFLSLMGFFFIHQLVSSDLGTL